MTRESEKSKIRMSVIVDGKHIYSLKKADKVIDQIFDEHEAQLEAKDEEIERLKEALEVLTVMCELGIKTQDKYSKIIQKMKVLNKAKDEEIDRQKSIANELLYTPFKKIMREELKAERKKARSIVAMLFWEWKKHKRMYGLSKFGSYLSVIHFNNATLSKLIFQKAYKMLKDTK